MSLKMKIDETLKRFETEISYVDAQLKAVENGIGEMNELSKGLDGLVDSTGKEILSPVGRGIFIKSKVLSEELLVDIGEKKFIKRSIPETKKIIESQVDKLNKLQEHLVGEMKRIDKELTLAMEEKTI